MAVHRRGFEAIQVPREGKRFTGSPFQWIELMLGSGHIKGF
jgi:hypothetical protein